MFLQMLKMVAQSIASASSLHRETCILASRVFKLHKWLLIAFCLENPFTQIATHDGMSIIFCQSCISLGQFVCHSKLLLHMHQASNIVLFSHSCQSVFVNSKISPLHMSLSSTVYWNFNNILSSHNSSFFITYVILELQFKHCIEALWFSQRTLNSIERIRYYPRYWDKLRGWTSSLVNTDSISLRLNNSIDSNLMSTQALHWINENFTLYI